MAANREDDRREAAQRNQENTRQQQQRNQGATGNLRSQLYAKMARIRSGRGENPGAGHGIDREFDRSVSENAMHTQGSGAEAQNRADLETHRTEIRMAVISGAIRKREQGHERADRTWDTGKAAKVHARTEKQFRRDTGGAAGLEEAGRTKKRNLTPQQAMARTTRRATEAGVSISHRKLDIGKETKRAQARPNAGRAFARPGRLEFGGGSAPPPPVRPGPRSRQDIARDRELTREASSRMR